MSNYAGQGETVPIRGEPRIETALAIVAGAIVYWGLAAYFFTRGLVHYSSGSRMVNMV